MVEVGLKLEYFSHIEVSGSKLRIQVSQISLESEVCGVECMAALLQQNCKK